MATGYQSTDELRGDIDMRRYNGQQRSLHLIERGIGLGVIVIASFLSAAAIGERSARQETQDRVVAVITDYELPPATLDAAWNMAPIIVRGQIQSSVVREHAGGRGSLPTPVTEHRVKLLEILKGAASIGTKIELLVAQNTVEASASPSGIAHKGGGELFKPSEEYVLFLEPLPGQSAVGVVWGHGGSFRLLDDTAIVPGSARKMWQFREQLTRDEFMYALRSRRDNKHGK